MNKYDDIINMERPISKKHAPMPLENRAAQFMPFAALTGYDDAVEETARLTSSKIELSEEKKAELDLALAAINTRIAEKPCAQITYFVPDETKAGGAYVTITSNIRKADPVARVLVLQDKSTISIDDILSIDMIDDLASNDME